MKDAREFLGLKVKDAVTGLEGIVTSIGYDLYGCVQAFVRPASAKKEDEDKANWLDVKRLKILNSKPVLPQPKFEIVLGPEKKSAPRTTSF